MPVTRIYAHILRISFSLFNHNFFALLNVNSMLRAQYTSAGQIVENGIIF